MWSRLCWNFRFGPTAGKRARDGLEPFQPIAYTGKLPVLLSLLAVVSQPIYYPEGPVRALVPPKAHARLPLDLVGKRKSDTRRGPKAGDIQIAAIRAWLSASLAVSCIVVTKPVQLQKSASHK